MTDIKKSLAAAYDDRIADMLKVACMSAAGEPLNVKESAERFVRGVALLDALVAEITKQLDARNGEALRRI